MRFCLSGDSKEKRILGKSRRRDKSRSRSPKESKGKDDSGLPFDPTNLDKVSYFNLFFFQFKNFIFLGRGAKKIGIGNAKTQGENRALESRT